MEVKKQAQELADLIIKTHKSILNSCVDDDENVSDEIVQILQAPLCLLTKLIVPNVHQKVNEIIYISQQMKTEDTLLLNQQQHGADITLLSKKTGCSASIEHKRSICKSKTGRCNFNWPLPSRNLPTDERRKKLLQSIRNKTGGKEGHAILEVVNGLGKPLASYKLSGDFLLGYFSRIALGKCDNHNLGCSRCKKCEDFHRLKKFQWLSNKLEVAGRLTDDEWRLATGKTDSSCSSYTN